MIRGKNNFQVSVSLFEAIQLQEPKRYWLKHRKFGQVFKDTETKLNEKEHTDRPRDVPREAQTYGKVLSGTYLSADLLLIIIRFLSFFGFVSSKWQADDDDKIVWTI